MMSKKYIETYLAETRKSLSINPIYQIPMYKYLNRRDLPFLMEACTLKISTNLHFEQCFKDMEIKDSFINDPFEGFNITYQDQTSSSLHNYGNVIISYVPRFYTLSLTAAPPERGKQIFCEPRYEGDKKYYDTCVRLKSTIDLYLAILNLTAEFQTFDGKFKAPFGRLFQKTQFVDVEYRSTIAPLSEGYKKADPGCKDTMFAPQEEYRFLFEPWFSQNDIPETFLIHLPGLNNLLEVVDMSNFGT